MKFLQKIIRLLDLCLSPELRQLESRDLFRVRFLVFAILFSIPSHLLPAALLLVFAGNSSWVLGSFFNLGMAIFILFRLRQRTEYQSSAKYFLIWVHILLASALWLFPTLYSIIYIWTPCLIVLSSFIIGVQWSFVSAIFQSLVWISNILWQSTHRTPLIGNLAFDDFSEQMPWQLFGSCLFMAIITGVFEFLRESNVNSQARKRLLTARNAHTGAVGELVGHMAHEVNNPLAILQGSVARLRKQLERNEWNADSRKLLQNMQRAHDRIIRVQQSLSVFASGNRFEPFVTADIRSIFKDVQLAMKPQAQAEQVLLEFMDRSSNASFRCQPHQIVYVICSMIQNSLDACRGQSNPNVVVEVKSDAKDLYLSVTDNGIGIDEQLNERIFRPFFTTKTGGSGQGLSLSVARGILAEHGGEIHFRSRPGMTTFICHVPRDGTPSSGFRKGA